MPKYRVSLMRTDEFVIDVEADDESDAIDMAYAEAPDLCAQCGGWGTHWGVDAGDWQPASEFNPGNPDVELISD